jgi:hypothetical protein
MSDQRSGTTTPIRTLSRSRNVRSVPGANTAASLPGLGANTAAPLRVSSPFPDLIRGLAGPAPAKAGGLTSFALEKAQVPAPWQLTATPVGHPVRRSGDRNHDGAHAPAPGYA